MNKAFSSAKWLIWFVCIFLALVILAGVVIYAVDPCFRFRYLDERQYALSCIYSSAGLIHHYDYDTLILGSSMTQNFNMDTFREKMNVHPLHVGIGGVSLPELGRYAQLAEKVGKAEKCYICVDLQSLKIPEPLLTPEFLLEDGVISELKYFLNYETWLRFTPIDLGFSAINKLGLSLPSAYQQKTDVDYLGNWADQFQFDEEVVLRNYVSGMYSTSKKDPTTYYQDAVAGIDAFFSMIDTENHEYLFFFPPYSAFYWYNQQSSGLFDIFMALRSYFVQQAEAHGCVVYDFQIADFTSDLNHYKDTTHYAPDINDWMVECFATEEYMTSAQDMELHTEQIKQNIDRFYDRYGTILAQYIAESKDMKQDHFHLVY